ncbi:MAG TPA: hypothetical protein VK809_12595 [Bacteroidia bacterium]|jgi:hypothetical protein|nr:hypothetical protein [Bacteroidia bacterium]
MKRIFLFIIFCCSVIFSGQVSAQCACCSSIGCGDNSGGGSALVKKGKLLLNLTSRYSSFKPLSPSQMVKDANSDTSFSVYNKSYQLTYTFSLTYGISNRLNLALTLPYNSISNIQTVSPGEGSVDVLGTSRGISNIKTSLQYVLLQRKCCMGWEVMPTIGLIAPTGVHSNVAMDGSIFDDQFQPGADAWVPVTGVTIDKMFKKITVRGVFTYVFQNTDPQGNVDAALWNTDISGYVPVIKKGDGCVQTLSDSNNTTTMKCTPSSFVLNAFAGLQLEHVGQDIIANPDGTKVYNSNIGAFRTYISAGLVANINQRLFVPVSIALPVYQQQNGYQVTLQWRLSAGLSYLLF